MVVGLMVYHLHAEAEGDVAFELGAAAFLPVGEEVYFVAFEHFLYVAANGVAPVAFFFKGCGRVHYVVAHVGKAAGDVIEFALHLFLREACDLSCYIHCSLHDPVILKVFKWR